MVGKQYKIPAGLHMPSIQVSAVIIAYRKAGLYWTHYLNDFCDDAKINDYDIFYDLVVSVRTSKLRTTIMVIYESHQRGVSLNDIMHSIYSHSY
jgi:hypothetical protein